MAHGCRWEIFFLFLLLELFSSRFQPWFLGTAPPRWCNCFSRTNWINFFTQDDRGFRQTFSPLASPALVMKNTKQEVFIKQWDFASTTLPPEIFDQSDQTRFEQHSVLFCFTDVAILLANRKGDWECVKRYKKKHMLIKKM